MSGARHPLAFLGDPTLLTHRLVLSEVLGPPRSRRPRPPPPAPPPKVRAPEEPK